MHVLVIWLFSLLQERIYHSLLYFISFIGCCLYRVIYMQYILHDCTLPVCIIICTQKYIEQFDLCTIILCIFEFTHNIHNINEYRSIHNNNGVKLVRRQRCGRVLMKEHPFTLAIYASSTTDDNPSHLHCACAGGGMQASTPPHTKHKANTR